MCCHAYFIAQDVADMPIQGLQAAAVGKRRW